jgi:predicted nucleic acid-binding protein
MNYVFDCSFCAALFIPDEKSELAAKIFNSLKEDDQITIPLLWWYEFTNVLNLSVKRNRLKHNEAINMINLFEDLQMKTDDSHGSDYTEKIFNFSRLYQLPAYDAAYLELALRTDSILASLDEQLCEAAVKAGIEIIK